MIIEFKNLGALKQAEFSLGDFTIICGNNNTGKTYATYAIYGFLSTWRESLNIKVDEQFVSQLLTNGTTTIDLTQYTQNAKNIISEGCKVYTEGLPMIFASKEENFKTTQFHLTLKPEDIELNRSFNRTMKTESTDLFAMVKEENSTELVITLLVSRETVKIPRDSIVRVISDTIKEIVFGHLFPKPFIASAERTGAAIFRKELNFARNRLLEEMSKTDKKINPFELLFRSYQDYPLPVKDNVDFTREIASIAKSESYLVKNHPELISDFYDIIGGKYTVNKSDELYYEPKGIKIKLPMDESSSAVRSLLDIGFYINHIARPGDLLMVDEPELNLHPENQRKVARLFAILVNLGIKVFITTHSDYFIKELSTLIMLKRDKPYLKEIAKREGYKETELLEAKQVKMYIAEGALIKLDGGKRKTKCQTLTKANISQDSGIEARSFDQTIETMNRIQEDIVWGE